MRRIVIAALAVLGLAGPAMADRALVVGVDVYADPALGLKLPGASGRDVERISALLTGTLGYKADDIRVLRDGEASRANILDGLDNWLGGAKRGERVYFYFAGQGFFVRSDGGTIGALVPADARAGSGGTIGGMVTDKDLANAFARLKGRSITAVIDSSVSGTVTRAISVEGAGRSGNDAARSPQMPGATRSIAVEPAAAEPPSGGEEAISGNGDVTIWRAVSPTQVALIDEDAAPNYRGVFTTAYADGIEKGLADRNRNGTVSNQELLDFVRERSTAYCTGHRERCEMGLTPILAGEGAPLEVAATVSGGTSNDGVAINQGPIRVDKILDILGAKPSDDLKLAQIPPSPVTVGTKDIHFQVTSPNDGFLVLLSLSDDGELVQLFPNSRSEALAKDGRIFAHRPVTVPDASYGISFDATSATKGTLIALVAADPLHLPSRFTTRAIEVIPADVVNGQVLPDLAKSLAAPAVAEVSQTNIKAVERSVTTLRYEIVP